MNLHIILIILVILSPYAYAKEVEAPFGFIWGLTKSQIESKDVVFEKCDTDGDLTQCITTKPIKSVSFGEKYLLVIHIEKGLQKIIMVSLNTRNDITGSEGKGLYSKIKKAITDKYGNPHEYEYSGVKVYKEYDEFYQCLNYSGCGNWTSFWEPKEGGSIALEIKGVTRGEGFLKLSYESKDWSDIINERQQKSDKKDTDSL